MRIIGGKWKGRRVQFPSKNWPVRPTTDFAREALFNILDNRLDYAEIRALDLFGGTGMHTLELASRGCRDITYVDKHRASVKFLQSLVKDWELPAKIIAGDAMAFIKQSTLPWNYIFADPPYEMKGLESLVSTILSTQKLTLDGFFVLEHKSTLSFDKSESFLEARHYGQTVFSFFGQGS